MSNTITKDKTPTRFTTNIVRLTYAHIWQPRAQESDDAGDDKGNNKKKYQCCLLIPKTDGVTFQRFQAAFAHAYAFGQKKGFWGSNMPANFHSPLRDGDAESAEKGEEYVGNWFFNTSSINRPKIVDANLVDIIEEDEVYSGCYANVVINLFPFNAGNKKKGIGCGLEVIRKVADGEHLGIVPINLKEAFAMVMDDTEGDLPFPGELGYDGPIPAGMQATPTAPGYRPQMQNSAYTPQTGMPQQSYPAPQPVLSYAVQAPEMGSPPQQQYPMAPQTTAQGYPHQGVAPQAPIYSQQPVPGSILPNTPPVYPPQVGAGTVPPLPNGIPGAVPNQFTAGVDAADAQLGQIMNGGNTHGGKVA